MQANSFLSLLKCHQSMGWQAGLSTCQAPTPLKNRSTHILVFKNDLGSDIHHRISTFTDIIWTCLRHSASYRYIGSHLSGNGQNRTNNILYMINIFVQTCHSIRRCTGAGQHTGENKNDENYSRRMDSGVHAARSWTDMRWWGEPLVTEMMICNVMFVILIYGVLWRMRRSVTIRRRIQLTNRSPTAHPYG